MIKTTHEDTAMSLSRLDHFLGKKKPGICTLGVRGLRSIDATAVPFSQVAPRGIIVSPTLSSKLINVAGLVVIVSRLTFVIVRWYSTKRIAFCEDCCDPRSKRMSTAG